MTLQNENNYKNLQDCCICNQKIKDKEDKVRYHCYLTSEFKGPAHKECSKIPRKLPIIFHNLEGYVGHLIFTELNNFKDIDIQVIPKTNERYMSIIVNNSLIFLDSLQFCKASSDSLAGNSEDNDFKHLDDGKRGKGDGHIYNEKYLHLKNVWNTFNSKTFKDFHDHYLKKDVLLLTDVFEKFIDICLKN